MEHLYSKNYIFVQTDEGGFPGQRDEEKFQQYRTSSTEPPQIDQIFESVDKVLDYIFPIGVFLAVIFIVIGGYMWMSSAGNPEKVKQAQGTLTWAIIGLILLALARVLVEILFATVYKM
jgi:type IV secretory pathway VirB2 component (pilin)